MKTASLVLMWLLAASVASAQTAVQRTFINPGFEAPVLPSNNCWTIRAEVDVPGWSTTEPPPPGWAPNTWGTCGGHPDTAPDGGIQMFRGNGGVSNRLPNDGNQYAELNAFTARRLYQEVCLLSGEQIDWSLAHAARLSANEQAAFNIGTNPSGSGSQQIVRMRAGNSVAQGPVACGLGTCSLDGIDANGWREYSGSFNWNQPTGTQTIGFQAVTGGSTGNILDNIRIGLRPFVEFAQDAYDQNENTPTSNRPRLLVAGRVAPGGMTVPVFVAGGTATLGLDYTTASGTADVSVFIPEGDYDGVSFPLPITIIDDGPGDDGETITFNTPDTAGTGAPYNRASLRVCGGIPRANTTSTIAETPNPLPRIQLSKALSVERLAVSDQFVLIIDGPNGRQTTTTGSGSAVGNGSITVGPARIGEAYTLSEVMAGGSPTPLSSYFTSISCTNTDPNSTTVLPGGSGNSFSLTLAATDNVSCVITNDVASAPSFIDVIKTVTDGRVYADVGDTATYRYVVTNTGTEHVNSLVVTDDKVAAVVCPVTALAPGASTNCTSSYVVTQADIDNTLVTNIATASARSPTNELAIDTDDAVIYRAFPSLTVEKSTTTTSYTAVGQDISYVYLITNTGNIEITSLVVSDDRIATVNCPVTALVPGESTTCTANYTVSQADLDAGSVTNLVRVTGTPAAGSLGMVQDSETVNGIAAPALVLDKAAVSGDPYAAVGDMVGYQYRVINTGNVTIDSLLVTDDRIATVSCPVTALAPGASTICTASYTVTQADLDVGSVTNHATALGNPPGDLAQVNAEDSTTVPPTQDIGIRLDKSGSGPVPISAGDTVAYNFVVENTGSVSLVEIGIIDPLPGLSPVSCPSTSLTPGERMTCTATYIVTLADISAGIIANSGTVTGRAGSGRIVSDQSSTSMTLVLSTVRNVPVSSKVVLLMLALLLAVAAAGMLRGTGSYPRS